MGFKCSTLNCKSGYKSSETAPDVSFHRFPKDPDLLQKWLRNISRKDFILTDNCRLCSLHFKDDDFLTEHADSNSRRATKRDSSGKKLNRRRLAETAIPCILEGVPATSLFSPPPARTTVRATSVARRVLTLENQQEQEVSLFVARVQQILFLYL